MFFLRTLAKQSEVLRQKVENHRLVQIKQLSPFSAEGLRLFGQHPHLSIREIVARTNSNRNTVKNVPAELVKEQLLAVEGKGRSIRYPVVQRQQQEAMFNALKARIRESEAECRSEDRFGTRGRKSLLRFAH